MKQLYEDHKHIIKAMVLKSMNKSTVANKHTLYKELIAEGNLIFAECAARYDGLGNFDKYLSTSLYLKLLRCNKRENDWLNYLFEDYAFIVDSTTSFLDKDPLYFITEGLSDDAKIVVEETLEIFPKQGRKKKILCDHFKKTFGWKRKRVMESFYEIKRVLAT